MDLRKSVAKLFGRLSTTEILNVFKDKPIPRRTIFRILKDCREGKKQENKKKSGRPPVMNRETTTNLLKCAKNKVGVSQRRLTRKYGVNLGTVCSILKRNNLFTRQHKRAPKYTEKQLEKVPVC